MTIQENEAGSCSWWQRLNTFSIRSAAFQVCYWCWECGWTVASLTWYWARRAEGVLWPSWDCFLYVGWNKGNKWSNFFKEWPLVNVVAKVRVRVALYRDQPCWAWLDTVHITSTTFIVYFGLHAHVVTGNLCIWCGQHQLFCHYFIERNLWLIWPTIVINQTGNGSKCSLNGSEMVISIADSRGCFTLTCQQLGTSCNIFLQHQTAHKTQGHHLEI